MADDDDDDDDEDEDVDGEDREVTGTREFLAPEAGRAPLAGETVVGAETTADAVREGAVTDGAADKAGTAEGGALASGRRVEARVVGPPGLDLTCQTLAQATRQTKQQHLPYSTHSHLSYRSRLSYKD
jgi:hypothetical protein